MSFKDNEAIREAKAIEEDARADVKEARNHLNIKQKEKKSLVKDAEIATANHNFKAAIARRKAATQTRLASEGKDPEPKKVGNESLCIFGRKHDRKIAIVLRILNNQF